MFQKLLHPNPKVPPWNLNLHSLCLEIIHNTARGRINVKASESSFRVDVRPSPSVPVDDVLVGAIIHC